MSRIREGRDHTLHSTDRNLRSRPEVAATRVKYDSRFFPFFLSLGAFLEVESWVALGGGDECCCSPSRRGGFETMRSSRLLLRAEAPGASERAAVTARCTRV